MWRVICVSEHIQRESYNEQWLINLSHITSNRILRLPSFKCGSGINFCTGNLVSCLNRLYQRNSVLCPSPIIIEVAAETSTKFTMHSRYFTWFYYIIIITCVCSLANTKFRISLNLTIYLILVNSGDTFYTYSKRTAVSYTHLTLPTICSV